MVQARCNSSLNENNGTKDGQKLMNSAKKKKKKRTFTGVSEEELVNRAVKEGPQIPGLHNWIIVGAIG